MQSLKPPHSRAKPRPQRVWARCVLVAFALVSLGASGGSCLPGGIELEILSPLPGQVSRAGDVTVVLRLPPEADVATLVFRLDGAVVAPAILRELDAVRASLSDVAVGPHVLEVALGGPTPVARQVAFDLVELVDPDGAGPAEPGECEILNAIDCLLPYPSNHYLVPAATPTGSGIALPQAALPTLFGQPLLASDYAQVDGFSPVTSILMHFPGNLDPAMSGAPRVDPVTRTYDERSLEADSPSVLLEVSTGRRILHFLERDGRLAGAAPALADREVLFMRTARSLRPAERYVVAITDDARRPDGSPGEPEPIFRAFRDGLPSDIPELNARRAGMEQVFADLAAVGVPRERLVLAFAFDTRSDDQLTADILAMRDQTYAFIDEQLATCEPVFTATIREDGPDGSCSLEEGTELWRIVDGTFEVPLFLDSDPVAAPATPSFMNRGPDGLPAPNGTLDAKFSIGIPCSVLEEGTAAPVVLGHGLAQSAEEFVGDAGSLIDVANAFDLGRLDRIVAGTDWTGFDADFILSIGNALVTNQVDQWFRMMPDRLRQANVHFLALARLLDRGAFGIDPAFQVPGAPVDVSADGCPLGVFPGAAGEMQYIGASMGAILGGMFTATTADVERAVLEVPGTNFGLILPRANAQVGGFNVLGTLVNQLNTDPIARSLALTVSLDLWVVAEGAGYLNHVTSDPLPGTDAVRALLLVARHDHLVSNLAAELMARSYAVPNLHDPATGAGSAVSGLAEIPDDPGPIESSAPGALVYYDLAMYAGFESDATLGALLPPIDNTTAPTDICNPHSDAPFAPTSIEKAFRFVQTGAIMNTCNGACDGFEPPGGPGAPFERLELEDGRLTPCDPLPSP